jgi:hypothetical protein
MLLHTRKHAAQMASAQRRANATHKLLAGYWVASEEVRADDGALKPVRQAVANPAVVAGVEAENVGHDD